MTIAADTLSSPSSSVASSTLHPGSPPDVHCRLPPSRGEVLDLGAVDEDELYAALMYTGTVIRRIGLTANTSNCDMLCFSTRVPSMTRKQA
jgi:hypothetical protein